MPTKEDFLCNNCGACCLKFTVKLSDTDVRRIEKLGFKKNYFAETDDFDKKFGNYALKRVDDKCIFLEKKKNKYFCRIYEKRPSICKDYPFIGTDFIDSCKPRG